MSKPVTKEEACKALELVCRYADENKPSEDGLNFMLLADYRDSGTYAFRAFATEEMGLQFLASIYNKYGGKLELASMICGAIEEDK